VKVFIAGVMQGNRKDNSIHPQEYRSIITEKLLGIFEDVEVIDPNLTDPNRLAYTREQANNMFMKYCHIASEVDLLISFLPEASMGSAIEMWIAYQNNVPIITISPMKTNWVIKLLSKVVYRNLKEFLNTFNAKVLNT
jgi:hypothetical protein